MAEPSAKPAGGWTDNCQFQLIVPHRTPGVDAPGAQFCGKFPRKSMHREHPLWTHPLNALEESQMVGVVGKRDQFTGTVAVARCGLQCPTGGQSGPRAR